MTIVGSDPLAELVWSPRTGLSIKFADKKPCLMWEVGPSNVELLQSEDTQDQKHVSEGHSVASLATCRVSGRVAKSSSSAETLGSRSHGHTGPQNQRATDPLSECLKIEAMTQCGPREHVKINKDGCSSDPFRENVQDAFLKNIKRGEDRERSFHCRENDEKHEVESYGSMESCKSATSLTKRKRRLSLEEQMILGSKRIKKQRDNSFMNWLSNMLKGLKNHENCDQNISLYDRTRGFESRKMGFRNVFQSLLLPDVKAQETITQMENKSVGSSKETALIDKCRPGSIDCEKEAEGLVKRESLYERVTKEAPKGMFDIIRRLRLSRTDILKWTNSRLSVAHLDGFFVRLRLAKWEEGGGGSKYHVACITGLQGEYPWKGLKQPIHVKVGGVECFVESQYVSNCDFLEDELIAWWQKRLKNGGIPVVKDLESKLAERRTLGL